MKLIVYFPAHLIVTTFSALFVPGTTSELYLDSGVWKKLNIVLTYSTEAFSFIADLNQSSFNVGIDFNLIDFNRTQVETLNWQHGSPIKTVQEMDVLMDLLRGHPYLVRKALYVLVMHKYTFNQVIQKAFDEDGPFSDHFLPEPTFRKLEGGQFVHNPIESLIAGKIRRLYCICSLTSSCC